MKRFEKPGLLRQSEAPTSLIRCVYLPFGQVFHASRKELESGQAYAIAHMHDVKTHERIQTIYGRVVGPVRPADIIKTVKEAGLAERDLASNLAPGFWYEIQTD